MKMQYDANDAQILSPWLDEGVNPYGYRVNIRNPYVHTRSLSWRSFRI